MGPLALLLILSLLQGLTEYLPVSSSGHLVLARLFLPGGERLPNDATVEVWLHLGTLGAVLVFYRREILNILAGLLGRGPDVAGERRLALYIILGSIPAAIVGLGLEEAIEATFAGPGAAACGLLVTGTFLWASRWLGASQNATAGTGATCAAPGHDGPSSGTALCARLALIIGCAQALAILPGISRSGATIVTALYLGLTIERAAAFSFLLSIPAVGGAAILKLPDLMAQPLEAGAGATAGQLFLALLCTFLVGLAALKLLLRIARSRRLHWFAPYCWTVGCVAAWAALT
ncbi:MAG: undecaprenyl-diphosphate phosphatase [Planctomycetota bacterium]|jgi:undecaprenyl-diphosphatase|nr:undecaprenyl-diphosphate phosphatase [Planctomycetota bacterium]